MNVSLTGGYSVINHVAIFVPSYSFRYDLLTVHLLEWRGESVLLFFVWSVNYPPPYIHYIYSRKKCITWQYIWTKAHKHYTHHIFRLESLHRNLDISGHQTMNLFNLESLNFHMICSLDLQ